MTSCLYLKLVSRHARVYFTCVHQRQLGDRQIWSSRDFCFYYKPNNSAIKNRAWQTVSYPKHVKQSKYQNLRLHPLQRPLFEKFMWRRDGGARRPGGKSSWIIKPRSDSTIILTRDISFSAIEAPQKKAEWWESECAQYLVDTAKLNDVTFPPNDPRLKRMKLAYYPVHCNTETRPGFTYLLPSAVRHCSIRAMDDAPGSHIKGEKDRRQRAPLRRSSSVLLRCMLSLRHTSRILLRSLGSSVLMKCSTIWK